MKIGIISDTHKHTKRAIKAIDFLVDLGCEYFIHSGDIVQIEVIDYIEKLDKQYCGVFGNNDKHLHNKEFIYNLHHEPYCTEIENTSIKIMHHPYYLTPSKENIVIYGHTHTQICEYTDNNLFLNSGEVCARDGDFSQVMTLDISLDKYLVSCFNRKTKTKNWKEVKHIFNR